MTKRKKSGRGPYVRHAIIDEGGVEFEEAPGVEVRSMDDVHALLEELVASEQGRVMLIGGSESSPSAMMIDWDGEFLGCLLDNGQNTYALVTPEGVELDALSEREDGNYELTTEMLQVGLPDVLAAVEPFVMYGRRALNLEWAEGPSKLGEIPQELLH